MPVVGSTLRTIVVQPLGGLGCGPCRSEQYALRAIIGRRCRPPLARRLLSRPNQLKANPADPITTKQQGVTDRMDALSTGSSGSGLPCSEGLPT